MEAIIRNFLLSLLVPALLAGASFWMLSGRSRLPRSWAALLAGMNAAIAVALGYFFLSGRLPLLPKESTHWLIYVGVVAAVAAALIAALEAPSARVAIMVAAVTLVTFPLVRPLWVSSWKPVQAVWLTGMILAFGTIGWAMLNRAMEHFQKSWVMASVVMIFACSSVAVAASGSVSLAQFGGIFTAVIFPLIFIAWRRPSSAVLALAIPFSALALLAVLINARFYADLGWIAAVLILLSPVAGWVVVRFGPDHGFLAQGFARFMVMSAPAAGAAMYAILTSAPSGY